MLDGNTSVDDIKKRLTTLGHDIADDELQLFLKQLGAANFFENVLPNQAESLYQMATLRRTRKSLWTQAKKILYIKVPLVDPDRAFTVTMRYIDFLWSKWAMAVYVALLAFALWAFHTNYEEAARNFSGLLSPENLLAFWVIFIVEKFFHELGHGLTCKHFGGEVHEMGALVLVLTPCMYCNISDAWILEKSSRKFWISAAGIVTEIVIASLAAIVWWATGPGPVNSIAYRVMILAGLSSVLINGNPLMKWDGYYILSDVLGIPNLRENSVRFIGQCFRKYVLGMRVPAVARFGREAAIKLVYGALSSAWIFYVMYRITKGMLARFPALGVWVLVSSLYGLVLVPLVRLSGWLSKRRGQVGDVNLQRLSAVAAAVALGSYFFFFYDMGYSVSAPCVIEPARYLRLKAPVEGVLVSMPFREGDLVSQGQVLATLENKQLELAVREMELQVRAYDLQIDATRESGDFVQADNLASVKSTIVTRIADNRARLDSLVIRAPFTGVILSPNSQSQLGRLLLEGDDICDFGDLAQAKVTIAVDEKDMHFVRERAPASVTLRSYPWRSFAGTVVAVSSAPLRDLPSKALSSRSSGPVVVRPDSAASVPLLPTYEVNILLENPDRTLLVGMVGKARIESGSRSLFDVLFSKFRESLRQTFGLLG
jgi:putative peptide zinc metalloprotease protein